MRKQSWFLEELIGHFFLGGICSLGFPFLIVGMFNEMKYGPSSDGSILGLFIGSTFFFIMYCWAMFEGEGWTSELRQTLLAIFIPLVLVPVVIGVAL